MKELLEKLSFVRDNLSELETVRPLTWMRMVDQERAPLKSGRHILWSCYKSVLFEEKYIDYRSLFDEITLLIACQIVGGSRLDKQMLASALLKYLDFTGDGFAGGYKVGTKELYIEKVTELENQRGPNGQAPATRQDIEDDYNDQVAAHKALQTGLSRRIIFDIKDVCQSLDIAFPHFTETRLLPYETVYGSIESKVSNVDGGIQNLLKKEQDDDLQDISDSNGGRKLTHKQRLLLLRELGVFENPRVQNLTAENRGLLMGLLIGRNIKNTENFIRNFDTPADQVKKDCYFMGSKRNKEVIDNLLKEINF